MKTYIIPTTEVTSFTFDRVICTPSQDDGFNGDAIPAPVTPPRW